MRVVDQTPSEYKMSNKKLHSVPVPQLYKEASRILKRLENKEGSLKTLVYNSKYKVRLIMASRGIPFSTCICYCFSEHDSRIKGPAVKHILK